MTRMLRLMLLLLLLMPSIARATIGDSLVKISCPVCSEDVQWYRSEQATIGRRLERDLRWDYFQAYFTCESCLFSGTAEDFNSSLDARTAMAIRDAGLERPAGMSSPVAERCHLAAQILRLRGASPEKVAFAYLNAVWVARLEEGPLAAEFGPKRHASSFQFWLPEQNFTEFLELDVWAKCIEIERALPQLDSLEKRRGASMVLAELLMSLGEYDRLLALLPQLDGLPPKTEAWVRTTAKHEALLLELALEQLELALADSRSKETAKLIYLGAELHRRLGHKETALAWYERALAQRDLEPRIREWIPEQMALISGPQPESQPWVPVLALLVALSMVRRRLLTRRAKQ